MEFVNIGPVYIRVVSGKGEGVGGRGVGVGWVVTKTETKKQDNSLVEFRVTMTSHMLTYTHKRPIFHCKA